MRAASVIFGILFILFSIAGIVNPGIWGMNVTPLANALHMAIGILAIVFGLQASELAATWFCWIVGSVFFGIGVSGVAGSHLAATAANYGNDAIHWVLGGLLFIAGYFAPEQAKVMPGLRQRHGLT
ncbi:MAG TPA: hypothetical protein V6D22_00300 [Candidatus Obscuribacterales bacterium]